MNSISKPVLFLSLVFCALLFPASAFAQGPLATGTGPTIKANIGFSYIQQQVPSSSTIPMYGLDAGATIDTSRRFGIAFDLGYARASNIFSSGHHSDMLNYLAGPVFYPLTSRRVQVFAHLLLGGARVTGATPIGQGNYLGGYANEFAWAGGGGLEIQSSPASAIRFGGDYLHTGYFDPTATLRGQGNLRAVVSFVYFPGHNSRHPH